MTFYWVNDYFVCEVEPLLHVLPTEDCTHPLYPPLVSTKLVAYGVRANSHCVQVFNFQQGVLEVKTGQSTVEPNKGGHIQLVDLHSRLCTCQKS